MLGSSLYHSSQPPSINIPNQTHLLTKGNQTVSERTLLTSVLHMMLGLPSATFPLTSSVAFSVSSEFPSLQHLNRDALQVQLSKLAAIGSQLQLLRVEGGKLKRSGQKMLQAFGVGLQHLHLHIERVISRQLETLHQEEGGAYQTEEDLLKNQTRPLSILGLSSQLGKQKDKLVLANQVVAQLPGCQSQNIEELHRSSVFLLNFYSRQLQIEELSEVRFDLHVPFRLCLKVYVDVCKAWLSFSPSQLLAYHNYGFFIDLTRALSMDGDRFFDVSKMVNRQLVPDFFAPSYRRIVELGKTVQFIKLYFKEESLMLFHQFLDVDEEFKQISRMLNPHGPHGLTQTQLSPPAQLTISEICQRIPRHLKQTVQTHNDNPFGIFDNQLSFLKLRRPQCKEDTQKEDNSSQSHPQTQGMANRDFELLLDQALQRLTLKCKIVLKQRHIRDSIDRALRGIKQFVLLGQGDFVHQFMELSWSILGKTPDKISKNNVLRIIQEAFKSSALSPFYEDVRESLAFTFMQTETGVTRGWRAFSFSFRCEQPVNFIFSSQSMRDYESVSNLLFRLRHCQYSLVSFWERSMKTSCSRLLKTRFILQRLIASLSTYVFSEIEQLWSSLLFIFESCDSILTLLAANESFLQSIKRVTVENEHLCSSLASLVKIIDKLERMGRTREEEHRFRDKTEAEQVWDWLLSLLDQARMIPHFAESFDFDFNTSP